MIIGRHGAYAEKVRCQALWAFPLPKNLNVKIAGPLFCGGITVFSPIIHNNIKSTIHVAAVGIGGLGHMAIKFLNSWDARLQQYLVILKKRGKYNSLEPIIF